MTKFEKQLKEATEAMHRIDDAIGQLIKAQAPLSGGHGVNPKHLGKDERIVMDFLNTHCLNKVDEIKSILD